MRANAKFMHYASRDEPCRADDVRYKISRNAAQLNFKLWNFIKR